MSFLIRCAGIQGQYLCYKSKEEGKDKELIQSSKDTIWVSDKNTRKDHIQESQEISQN